LLRRGPSFFFESAREREQGGLPFSFGEKQEERDPKAKGTFYKKNELVTLIF
jgi:hypothetical protein